jgi:LysM repeat protein
MRPGARYSLLLLIVVVAIIVGQMIVHAIRTDPRDSRAIVQRELTLNTLEPGEKVVREVAVFQRPAIDYFRATRGLLVLTNRRLLYLGVEPRDLLAAPDVPPTFIERDFPIDTMVHVTGGHTFLWITKAITVRTPNEKLKLGVPSSASAGANVLLASMERRHDQAVAESATARKLQEEAMAARKAAEAAWRKPQSYTVQRGDALGSIATQWNTTTDRLRALNHLPDNRIRVGQVILVRPAT